jgi:glycosyltransferase involved in cell wall biosynthesis
MSVLPHPELGKDAALSVLVVLSHYELSGVTTNTIDLCEGLKAIGHNVTLIIGTPTLDHQIAKQKYLLEKGVNVVNVPNVKGGILSRIAAMMAISKQLLTLRYDIIHMESIYLTFIPWLLRKKFTLTYHSYGLKKNFFSKNATHLVAISKEIKEDAIKTHGYKPENVSIVLHGVSKRFAELASPDEKQHIKQHFGIPQDKIVIGIVASIEPRKGHHFLLEAVKNLTAERREKIHLVFCGGYKGENSEQWIHELIAQYSLQDKVTFIPHQDPKPVYQVLDIFCLPSVWEGFPLVVLEAKLAGCCAVRSNVQGAEEQITEGQTGYLFETENPASLQSKLEYLIDNPERIKQVGNAGREDALKRFTLETMAKNTAKVYRKII